MRQIYRSFSILGTIIILALLVGCGQDNTGGSTGSGGSTGGTPSPLPTASHGKVTLDVDAASYHPGDMNTVTLSNLSSQTIYFQDHQTNCTVIELDMLASGSWQMVNKCLLMSPTGWHMLEAGKGLDIQIVPPSDRQWPTGVLRATLSYGFSRSIGSLTPVYSVGFRVV